MTDVFGLPDADDLLCHLLNYDRSGSCLRVRVYPEVGIEPVYVLRFDGVVYVDAPVFWKGAHFVLSTDTDCLALLRQLRVHDDLPGDDLVGKFGLYRARRDAHPNLVRVLAIAATREAAPL